MKSREIIKQITEIEQGVIPSCVWFDSSGSINDERWSQMSLDEISLSKRKYRKLFRKACRMFGVLPSSVQSPFKKHMLVSRYVSYISERKISG